MMGWNPFDKIHQLMVAELYGDPDQSCDNHDYGIWKESGEWSYEHHVDEDQYVLKYLLERNCQDCGDVEQMTWRAGTLEWEWRQPPEWLNLDGKLPVLSKVEEFDPEDKERP